MVTLGSMHGSAFVALSGPRSFEQFSDMPVNTHDHETLRMNYFKATCIVAYMPALQSSSTPAYSCVYEVSVSHTLNQCPCTIGPSLDRLIACYGKLHMASCHLSSNIMHSGMHQDPC